MTTTLTKPIWGIALTLALVAMTFGFSETARAGQNPAQGQAPAQGGGGGRGGRGGFSLPPLLMETDAFPDGGIVPQKFAGRGGVQPAFRFSNAPATTVTYAIIMHDVDVALQNNTGDVLHWMAWNIPASANGIPEGSLPPGSVQGNNLMGQPSYFGPGAPAGPRYHHYIFELYALNATLDLPATATRDDLLKAMQGKVVAKAGYVGRYRNEPAAAAAPAAR
jgi:Raf kinase inhibitor-like YbhB/YbcL family protein